MENTLKLINVNRIVSESVSFRLPLVSIIRRDDPVSRKQSAAMATIRSVPILFAKRTSSICKFIAATKNNSLPAPISATNKARSFPINCFDREYAEEVIKRKEIPEKINATAAAGFISFDPGRGLFR